MSTTRGYEVAPSHRGRSSGPGSPTGTQYRLRYEVQSAVIVELGATIRTYEIAARSVLDGFAENEPANATRGAVLIPWPNRIESGRYLFGGMEHQLPLNDRRGPNAIHGLARWMPWRLVTRRVDAVALSTTIYPQPGYPFLLVATIRYRLGPLGLSVLTIVSNQGARPAPFGVGHHPYLMGPDRGIDAAELRIPARTVLPTDVRWMPGAASAVAGTETDFRTARAIGSHVLNATYFDFDRRDGQQAGIDFAGTRVWMDRRYGFVHVFSSDQLPNSPPRRSLAIEPMTCPANAFRTGTGLIVLKPGQAFRGRWGITPKELAATDKPSTGHV